MPHILMSANCEWPGFSNSRDWLPRVGKMAAVVKASGAGLASFQELGQSEAAVLADRLGSDWWYQRSNLNCVFWRDDLWIQDGDIVDRNIRSYGQFRRTVLFVPLKQRDGDENVTVGASHFANRSAKDLNVSPVVAQRGQALDVNSAAGDRRRVIIGIDSNSPTASYGGRAELIRRGWKTPATNGVDIIATRPGVTIVGAKRLLSIPSDHSKAIVVNFTTNTGDPSA